MYLTKTHGRYVAVFTKREIRKLREAGGSGFPKNKEIILTLTEAGTLVNVNPPGMNGEALEILLTRARANISE